MLQKGKRKIRALIMLGRVLIYSYGERPRIHHKINQRGYSMYYPPQYPFYNPSLYDMAQGAKRDLKRTSNAFCWTLLVAMALMSGFIFLCGFYLKAVGYPWDYTGSEFMGFPPVLYYLALGMGYVVGLAAPAFLYFAAKRIDLSEALPFQKTGLIKTAACVFLGSAICMLANIPANMVVEIEKALGFSGNMPEMPLTNDPWVLFLYGITIAVVPPIVEELIFRGMVLHSLRKYGDGFAIVGSALLFGLYHGNFVQMVFAFIAGLIMALVVVRTGSLWTSILIHFINNAVSFAIEMTQRYAGEDMANQLNYIVMGTLLILGLISLIYILKKDKRFFRSDTQDPLFRFSTKLWALFANPGGVAVLIFSIFSSITILTSY